MKKRRSRSRRGVISTAVSALVVSLIGAAWFILAPLQAGGQVAYVMVAGNSMEPALASGDLALVRRAPTYSPGDVVAYRDPDMGPLIHRIVGLDGDRFVLKGDNNTFPDPYRPSRDEVIGRFWTRVDAGGDVLATLRAPHVVALMAASLGMVFFGTVVGVRDRGRMRGRGREAGRRLKGTGLRRTGISAVNTREVAAPLAAGVVVFALLTVFSFGHPSKRAAVEELEYQHTGTFAYTAEAPDEIYDSGTAAPGEPIFYRLVDRLDVSFDYRLDSRLEKSAAGAYQLTAELTDSTGWKRVFQIAPRTEFKGETFRAAGSIDLRQLRSAIRKFERRAGIPKQEYSLAVIARVEAAGSVRGEAWKDEFVPRVTFRVDPYRLYLVRGEDTDDEPLSVGERKTAERAYNEESSVPVLGLDVPIGTLRTTALAGLLVSIMGLLVVGAVLVALRRAPEPERIRSRFSHLLLEAEGPLRQNGHGEVGLVSFDDLVRVAARENLLILHHGDGGRHEYWVTAEGVTYRYRSEAPAQPSHPSAEGA